MEAGAVPIIISDKIQLPDGPDWSRFCYSVKESEVDTIPDLVTSVRADLEEKGSEARRVWERYFSDEATFNYLVDQAGCLIKNHRKTCLKARIREFVSFRNIKDKVKLALGR
jgi:hypothetical protein